MKQIGSYIIRPMEEPENVIVKDDNFDKITGGTWKIKANTFSGVADEFKINARSRGFARQKFLNEVHSPVYAVFYKKECLFFFRYYHGKRKDTTMICRCIGKTQVVKHWLPVQILIEKEKDKILSLNKDSFLVYPIFEK